MKILSREEMKNVMGGIQPGGGDERQCWATTCPDKTNERSGFGTTCPSNMIGWNCTCNEGNQC